MWRGGSSTAGIASLSPTALIEKEKPAILIYELTDSYLVGPPDRLP